MRWAGKRVSVVGLGKSNCALIRYLVSQGASIVARDVKCADGLGRTFTDMAQLGVDFFLGESYLDGLEQADYIFLTPGMRKDLPQIQKARHFGVPVSSEINLFFEKCPAPIIGITGSSGKTTTTTLIGAILEAAGHRVYVGGNIGRPLIDIVDHIPPGAWVVLELSSFQLELLDMSPAVAVMTNISPNHLDVHKTMDEYVAAKKRIFRGQRNGELLILNWDDPTLREAAKETQGRVAWFSRKEEPPEGAFIDGDRICFAWSGTGGRSSLDVTSVNEIRLLGAHNLENVLAAAVVGQYVGVTPGTIRDVVTSFTGVAHRLELVREAAGVKFYNDSIATSPARTVAALNSFTAPVWLIAGGFDKQLPFDDLAQTVLEKTKGVFLIGEAAEKIEKAITQKATDSGVPAPFLSRCPTLEEAVRGAAAQARAGDIVLLSPACASFDMFSNFEVRGEQFRKAVHVVTEGEMIQSGPYSF